MKIDRVWAMPNKQTFQIKPIRDLIEEEKVDGVGIDPFPFDYTVDVLEYLHEFGNESVDFGLFDPPYSPRQSKECYKGIGKYDTKNSTWGGWKDEMARVIKRGGKCISFGWNSGGLGKNRGFEIIRIRLVPHGAMHNDTICTVEERFE